MKRSKRATNSLNDEQNNGGIDLVEQLFFAGKAYLKINSLVKTPLHEFMAVERSGLLAVHGVRNRTISSCLAQLINTHVRRVKLLRIGERCPPWKISCSKKFLNKSFSPHSSLHYPLPSTRNFYFVAFLYITLQLTPHTLWPITPFV